MQANISTNTEKSNKNIPSWKTIMDRSAKTSLQYKISPSLKIKNFPNIDRS